ncbi:MAG: ABC-2 family transporter protein [Terrimicrobiaceae bacterium]|nr:ABC-2 family transporter protein [Terrimicrobiaceae bacterium]
MIRWLGLYSAVFSLGVQNAFVYRWNFFFRAAFGLLPLAATIWIWKAIFAERGADVGGYSFGEMVSYFVAVTVAESLVSPTDDEWQIAADIRDGRMSAFLLRPLDYFAYRASLFLSSRVVYAGVALVPLAAVVWWLPGELRWPADGMTWAVFAGALVMAAALQFLIAFVLATLAFWVLEISTLVFILYSFEYFLSGRIFPIDLLPAGLKWTLLALPFPYELYFPVAVWMGKLTGAAMWSGLAIQAAWTLGMFVLSRWLWRRGVMRYGAYGG